MCLDSQIRSKFKLYRSRDPWWDLCCLDRQSRFLCRLCRLSGRQHCQECWFSRSRHRRGCGRWKLRLREQSQLLGTGRPSNRTGNTKTASEETKQVLSQLWWSWPIRVVCKRHRSQDNRCCSLHWRWFRRSCSSSRTRSPVKDVDDSFLVLSCPDKATHHS